MYHADHTAPQAVDLLADPRMDTARCVECVLSPGRIGDTERARHLVLAEGLH